MGSHAESTTNLQGVTQLLQASVYSFSHGACAYHILLRGMNGIMKSAQQSMRYIINIGYILTILPQFAHLINPTAYLNYFLSPLAFSQTFSRSENLFPSSYVFLAPLPLRWDASDKSSWRVGNLTRLYPWPLPQSLAPIIQMSTKISSCCLLT